MIIKGLIWDFVLKQTKVLLFHVFKCINSNNKLYPKHCFNIVVLNIAPSRPDEYYYTKKLDTYIYSWFSWWVLFCWGFTWTICLKWPKQFSWWSLCWCSFCISWPTHSLYWRYLPFWSQNFLRIFKLLSNVDNLFNIVAVFRCSFYTRCSSTILGDRLSPLLTKARDRNTRSFFPWT